MLWNMVVSTFRKGEKTFTYSSIIEESQGEAIIRENRELMQAMTETKSRFSGCVNQDGFWNGDFWMWEFVPLPCLWSVTVETPLTAGEHRGMATQWEVAELFDRWHKKCGQGESNWVIYPDGSMSFFAPALEVYLQARVVEAV